MEGGTPLSSLGNLEREEPYYFCDVPFSLSMLKSSFVSLLVFWAGCFETEEGSFVRILLCIL